MNKVYIEKYENTVSVNSILQNFYDDFDWSSADLVVIKPNWIQESHEFKPDVWEPVITNPELIMTVIRGVAERLNGRGTICICDAPHTYANFSSIVARGDLVERISDIRSHWPDLTVELLDLRREIWINKEEVVVERTRNLDDPNGYVSLNLGKDSLFHGHSGEGRYYGADYDTSVVNRHHNGDVQEYLIAGTPMKCDIFINLPKMKTHKKTGITCCLKNLVGINGDKNWLPHHVEGSPETQGDAFPDERISRKIEQRTKKIGMFLALRLPIIGTWVYRKMRKPGKSLFGDSSTVIRNGNWEGNDTCWRMALDLNRALLYGNGDGTWRKLDEPKNYLAIVDGIVAGEGNGPLCPDSVDAGIIVCGKNPAETDAVVAKLMGYEPKQLPIVHEAFREHRWPIGVGSIDDVKVFDYRVDKEIGIAEIEPIKKGGFTPHFGWKELGSEKP